MARKNISRPQEAPAPEENEAVPVPGKRATEDDVVDQEPVDTGIIEEAPGLGPAEVTPRTGDPGDLPGFGRSPGLPDLGVGDGSAGGDASDVGADLGSTLLDDLGDTAGASDLPGLPDPADGIGDITDAGGAPPAFEDREGQLMSDDDPLHAIQDAIDEGVNAAADASNPDAVHDTLTAPELEDGADTMTDEAIDAYNEGDDVAGDFLMEAAIAAAEGAETAPDIVIESGDPITPDPEPEGQTPATVDPDAHPGEVASQVPPHDDGSDERRRQANDSDDDDDDSDDDSGTQGDGGSDGDDAGSGTQQENSMPVPDESAGAGGRGPLDPTAGGGGGDPAPETEESGHGGLIGTGGDVDPDPDLDDLGGAGALDTVTAGMGAIDPVDSTLLGGDEGDLAALADEPDAGSGLEIDLDDSLTDLDLEEGV